MSIDETTNFGPELAFIGKVGTSEDIGLGLKVMKMTEQERSMFFLEEALNDILEAVEDADDDSVLPVYVGEVPPGQVVLQLDDVARWVQTLHQTPNFEQNEHLLKLWIDMVSTTDTDGERLDVMPPEETHLKLIPKN